MNRAGNAEFARLTEESFGQGMRNVDLKDWEFEIGVNCY